MHWLLNFWGLWVYIGVALIWATADGLIRTERSELQQEGILLVWMWPLYFGWLLVSAPYWVPKQLWSLSRELKQRWDKRQAINNLMQDVSKRTPK